MQHVKRFAYECILILGIGVCALAFGCSGNPVAPQEPIIWMEIDDAQVRDAYPRRGDGSGCYTLMWCAHCNGGRGGYIRQKVACPTGKSPSVRIMYPGGN